jgi:hypothetical protein
MRDMLNFLPLLLLLLSSSVGAQRTSVVVPPLLSSCGDSPLLSELSTTEGVALLSAYGYDWKKPWACTKIESAWSTGATIFRFRKVTTQTDDGMAFSVLRVPGMEHIWVIPTDTGMLEVPHSESDPHNLAAFNMLLRLHKGPVDAAGWLDIGKLYMAILGHQDALPMKAEHSAGGYCAEDECSVSFSDRPVVKSEPYNEWTLDFAPPAQGKPAVLTGVSRETVQPKK